MAWKRCQMTGVPEESCAHCNPDRYLPPIKASDAARQAYQERKYLDTADKRAGEGDKSDQETEGRVDSGPESRIRERLVALRIVLARERKEWEPNIYANLAVDEMVIRKPTSLSELANCEHLTNTQISEFGGHIIEVIVAVVGE
jgi:hypothetical protein